MIKIISKWLVIGMLLAFFYMTGCLNDPEEPKVTIGEGPIVEKPIEVDSFNRVNHVIFGDMSITVSDTFSVVLRSHQNILDMMTWEVDDNTFYWGFNETVEHLQVDEILCEIKIPKDIKSVVLTGAGLITISGPSQEEILIELNGYGEIKAYGLEVSKASVFIEGRGEVEVFVNDELTGLIAGNGNVFYRGNPVINLPIIGSGGVIDDN